MLYLGSEYSDIIKKLTVLETGSSADGKSHYIKYVDGTLICYGGTWNVGVGGSFGNLYRSNTDTRVQVDYPHPFIELPSASVSNVRNGYLGFGFVYNTTYSQITLGIISYELSTKADVGYIAIGRWK